MGRQRPALSVHLVSADSSQPDPLNLGLLILSKSTACRPYLIHIVLTQYLKVSRFGIAVRYCQKCTRTPCLPNRTIPKNLARFLEQRGVGLLT